MIVFLFAENRYNQLVCAYNHVYVLSAVGDGTAIAEVFVVEKVHHAHANGT